MNPQSTIGILLVNTGTPDAPSREAITRYLRTFLMDRRIVNLPAFLWKPILNGIILRVRPEKTMRIYRRIWTPEGSPYLLHSKALERSMADAITTAYEGPISLRLVHRYGEPSMRPALRDFREQGIERLVVLPLYPQQALATTHSVHDELERLFEELAYRPELSFIWDYYEDPSWAGAVADYCRPGLLGDPMGTHVLFSFHSVPLRDVRAQDAYPAQVEESARGIAKILGLDEDGFSVVYQSKFDDTRRWLGPSLHGRIEELKARGVRRLLIACPGFAIDCTETLYDIDMQLRAELKWDFPGGCFDYIPCLNDSPAHVEALTDIITRQLRIRG
jgi:ferrochelatase